MPERLQKILAQSGYGSRRASEDYISAEAGLIVPRLTALPASSHISA